jgi:very-short-patch-repair endonuclease
LEQRLRDEPDLQAFFQESGEEPFFVKNLERVQGDERESIILSVGYGKGNDGRLRYMWGPLLQSGGYRSLNVAITRARSRMTLVTSFLAEELDPAANPSEGYKLMHHFVQFMSSGGSDFGDGASRVVEMNPFEEDIYNRLTRAGLKLEPQWGANNYRIDFAVRHPDFPGRFVLAIECDGAMYHSGMVARERDRLRQRHLENLGWKFHRIWSTDWRRDPDPQVAAVLKSYKDAIRIDPREPTAAPVATLETPRPPTATAERRGTRPRIHPGAPITSYSHAQLVALIRWIQSDDVVRSKDAVLEIAIRELGYLRRGGRIVETLNATIEDARRRRPR